MQTQWLIGYILCNIIKNISHCVFLFTHLVYKLPERDKEWRNFKAASRRKIQPKCLCSFNRLPAIVAVFNKTARAPVGHWTECHKTSGNHSFHKYYSIFNILSVYASVVYVCLPPEWYILNHAMLKLKLLWELRTFWGLALFTRTSYFYIMFGKLYRS